MKWRGLGQLELQASVVCGEWEERHSYHTELQYAEYWGFYPKNKRKPLNSCIQGMAWWDLHFKQITLAEKRLGQEVGVGSVLLQGQEGPTHFQSSNLSHSCFFVCLFLIKTMQYNLVIYGFHQRSTLSQYDNLRLQFWQSRFKRHYICPLAEKPFPEFLCVGLIWQVPWQTICAKILCFF